MNHFPTNPHYDDVTAQELLGSAYMPLHVVSKRPVFGDIIPVPIAIPSRDRPNINTGDVVTLNREEYNSIMHMVGTVMPRLVQRVNNFELVQNQQQLAPSPYSGQGGSRADNHHDIAARLEPIRREKATRYYRKYILKEKELLWDITKPFNYPDNVQKSDHIIAVLAGEDCLVDTGDRQPLYKYLKEKYDYLKSLPAIPPADREEKLGEKRRKTRVLMKKRHRENILVHLTKNPQVVPDDLSYLMPTAHSRLIIKRKMSEELSDVEGELKELFGDRYTGRDKTLYVVDQPNRDEDETRLLHFMADMYKTGRDKNSQKISRMRARSDKLVYLTTPDYPIDG